MSRLGWVLAALVAFATFNSILAVMSFLAPSATTSTTVVNQTSSSTGYPSFLLPEILLPLAQFLSTHSVVLAPTTWLLAGGVWIWRGRVKSQWEGLGFDSDVFRLFMKMKGGKSRMKLLSALGKPKDRYQLAKELGMDWRAVDQHVVALCRRGLVTDEITYGKVRMYQLTPAGKRILALLEDIDSETKRVSNAGQVDSDVSAVAT